VFGFRVCTYIFKELSCKSTTHFGLSISFSLNRVRGQRNKLKYIELIRQLLLQTGSCSSGAVSFAANALFSELRLFGDFVTWVDRVLSFCRLFQCERHFSIQPT
jgi:hypothetical protein